MENSGAVAKQLGKLFIANVVVSHRETRFVR